jgi:hypothetical protein
MEKLRRSLTHEAKHPVQKRKKSRRLKKHR